jgi:uncharacterized protein (TIGR02246 family)
MSIQTDPPRYQGYLLRLWQERHATGGQSAVWRFSLEDAQTGQRQGFACLDALMAALRHKIEQRERIDPSIDVFSRAELATTNCIEEGTLHHELHTEDEARIRAIVAHVERGWNTHDGRTFAESFADDADYVVVDGRYIKGRPTIAAGHQQIFDTIYQASATSATVRSIRFLRDDIAIAHVEWHLTLRQGDLPQAGLAISTLVLAKAGGEWSISAFQNTRIMAP